MRGSSSHCRVAGPRVRTTRASEPLRRRICGFRAGGGHEQRAEKAVRVGIVADDEEVFALGALAKELLEVFEGGGGGERGRS